MRKRAFALKKLYDGLFSVIGEEILPSYSERESPSSLKTIEYLDCADGQIEQFIISYLDRYRTKFIEQEKSAFEMAEKELELCKVRQQNLKATLKKIQNHIRRLRNFEQIVFEKILSDDVSPKLKEAGICTRKLGKKYVWLNRLLSGYGVILMADEKIFEESFKHECRKGFGERLRQARKSKGFTAEELAKKIGMTQGGYSCYETGIRDLPTPTIYRLARILEVETDWLFCLKG